MLKLEKVVDLTIYGEYRYLFSIVIFFMSTLLYPNLVDFLQTQKNLVNQPTHAFVDHMLGKIDEHIKKWWRVLLLALTKKSSEEITNFLLSKWYKAYYLHSEIDTMERRDILTKLKTGAIDIVVGVNLLREGIDLPEVSLIAILDADKEGFLRSQTALIQIIWRAARNPDSEVILYADVFTESIVKSLWETYRRRAIQEQFNDKHAIQPQKVVSQVKRLQSVKTGAATEQEFIGLSKWKNKRLKRATKAEKAYIMKDLRKQLDEAIQAWEFEKAAGIRDQIKEIEES